MKKYLGGVVYNFDRFLGSMIFDCEPQETISSQIGRRAAVGCRWAVGMGWVLDHTLSPHTHDHCAKAVEHADKLIKADDGIEQ